MAATCTWTLITIIFKWVTIPCAILDNISSKYKAVRGEMVEMDSLGQLVGRDKKEKRDQP